MKKIVLALAAVSSLSFAASGASAQTAKITFNAFQSFPVNGCEILSDVTVNSSTNYTIKTNGSAVTGPGLCSNLLFMDDVKVSFGANPITSSTNMTLGNIKIFTVLGECNQPVGIPSGAPTPPNGTTGGSGPNFTGTASGYVYGIVYPSTPTDCFVEGVIEFNM